MKQTYQMYFGRNTPQGYVTDEQWDEFKDILDMTFQSYTVSNCQGVWKGEPEMTKYVTVNTKHRNKVVDVCASYAKVFGQDAVGLLISEPMHFVTKEAEVY
tara:strand:- start:452 stop:754 length:303 start_codon:yes stop_codon:yes gene_type:complete